MGCRQPATLASMSTHILATRCGVVVGVVAGAVVVVAVAVAAAVVFAHY